MKRILLTGASGVLGQELIYQFLTKTDKKLFVISSQTHKLENLYEKTERITYFNLKDWKKNLQFEDVDLIIHGAFSRTEQGSDIVDSLNFTKNLFLTAAKSNMPIGIVNISSRSVYGQNDEYPWTEASALMPESKYALGKVANELISEILSELSCIRVTNIRLAGLIGINMDARVIAQFVKLAIEDKKIKVMGGQQHFSLLDTRDAAAAIVALTDVAREKWRETYNLGSKQQYTLLELAEKVCKISSEFLDEPVGLTLEKSGNQLLDEMDSELFYTQVGWEPQFTIDDTIRLLFKHYLKLEVE